MVIYPNFIVLAINNNHPFLNIKKSLKKLKISLFQRECISVHIGQAGCQIGNACWELYVSNFFILL